MATIGSKEMKYFAKLLVTNLIIVFLVLLLLIFSLFDYNEICVYFLLSTCMPIVLYMYAYCSVHVCLLFCTCMPIVLYMYAYCSVHVIQNMHAALITGDVIEYYLTRNRRTPQKNFLRSRQKDTYLKLL
jgi:hypothetical protein